MTREITPRRVGGDIPQPWSATAQEVARALAVAPAEGLSSDEVARRRALHGANRLRERRARPALRVLVDQLRSWLVALLATASGLALAFGEPIEGGAIAVVVVLNTAIGFFTELRAIRSIEALRRMVEVRAIVRRDAQTRSVSAIELVPGDIVALESGDVVPADVRLVESSKLEVDESALTGESVPVAKQLAAVDPDAPVMERRSMLFQGTALTRGNGIGIVVATGMRTELGRISALVAAAEPEATPLEQRLEALGRGLGAVAVAVAAGIAVLGIASGRDVLRMVETAIALSVAAVPEGLPIVATLALAHGMWRMARRNALVERLSAVETLGSTSVILTDKTGTLTENRMRAVALHLADGPLEITEHGFRAGDDPVDPAHDELLRAALRVAVLCNNASLARGQARAIGDPTETALLEVGAVVGLYRDELLAVAAERREEAFEPAEQRMATFHEVAGGFEIAVKGGPEAVLACCTRVRTREGTRVLDDTTLTAWLANADAMAARGMRVLGLATRRASSVDVDPYRELELLGWVGLLDPPRAGVRDAIQAFVAAGIRVVMVTGDHPATAATVAEAVGLMERGDGEDVIDARRNPGIAHEPALRARALGARVIARATPEQKLELIALHQANGAVVAMMGDGVNDAPALRKADIGIAMGLRGTQVAREAAGIVLQDDEFATIAVAVEQGRVIFANIRKFVVYLLSCNASEVLIVAIAALVKAPLPLLPLQILFLNLVTDVFPALALGLGRDESGAMRRPPRPAGEPILTHAHWRAVVGYAVLLTAAVLGALAAAVHSGMSDEQAVTVSFFTLASAQLWHIFDMRSSGTSLFRNEVTTKPWVWGALALCGVLLVAAGHLPILADVLDLHPIGLRGGSLVLGFGLAPVVAAEIGRAITRMNSHAASRSARSSAPGTRVERRV
jgi:Ca2+-transporting ATPase